MASFNLFLLPGDGIGTEIMTEVKEVVSWFEKRGVAKFECESGLVGGSAYDAHGKAISDSDMALAQASDAVIFGAVGGPKWADVPYDVRPEAGLLRLRKDLGLFANLRPAICYPALADASALKRELPLALHQLQKGNIAPVDMAQAAIGPGMAIFSRYSKVLEADGSSMRVRTALQLINQHLDEYLSEQEGEYDPDTRWALSWFEQYGMNEGPFGDAETLSKAKNTSVQGMVDAGILKAGAGKARLLKREEMDASWNPNTDKRLTVWEAAQHLIRVLEAEGESGAADLQQQLGGLAQSARDLAYRLYSICERQGWSQEALAYNSLVTVWPRLMELGRKEEAQRSLESFL